MFPTDPAPSTRGMPKQSGLTNTHAYEPVIQMDNWRHNSAICPHPQSKGGPRSRSGPSSEFDFTGRASSRPARWAEWGGSWVLRTSWLERLEVGRAKFRESAAVEGPICLLCLVCTPNRADGWSPSSSINSSALPSSLQPPPFSAQLFLGRQRWLWGGKTGREDEADKDKRINPQGEGRRRTEASQRARLCAFAAPE